MKATYRIADKNIEIDSIFDKVHKMCEDYRTDAAPELFVKILPGDIDSEREKSEKADENSGNANGIHQDPYLETLAVYRKISEQMPYFNTMLFHGSCVSVDGAGYIFAAESGTGKSTHTRLWREYLGDRAVMVNDDKPLIKTEEGKCVIYGTPWNGKHRLGNNISVPLKAVCLLERGEENSIEKIDKKEALPFIIRQTYRPKDPVAMARTLQLIDDMKVGFYRLRCNMDVSAAKLSYEFMSSDGKQQ